MRKAISILFVLSLLVTHFACIETRFAPVLNGDQYTPVRAVNKVQVFRTKKPDRAYIEIGTVQSCCDDDFGKLVFEIRKKAAVVGGDAIIDLKTGPQMVTATVIRFKKSNQKFPPSI